MLLQLNNSMELCEQVMSKPTPVSLNGNTITINKNPFNFTKNLDFLLLKYSASFCHPY